MALWFLILYTLYLMLAFVGRALLQLRRTGSMGFAGIGGRRGSVEWTGGVLFVAASVLVLAAPVLDLAGALEPIAVLDGSVGHAFGFVLFSVGLAGTLLAQVWMGSSWRVGVDEEEKTELVVRGPFALVRNPIFSAMVPAILGLALLVPNAAAVAGFVALVCALELQVRFVEEPYLLRTHGTDYTAYTSRVGRFVPGIGLSRNGRVR